MLRTMILQIVKEHIEEESDPDLPPVTMNACLQGGAPYYKRLQLTPDHKKNYKQSIAKDTGKVNGSLYRSSKYLHPHTILYIYMI